MKVVFASLIAVTGISLSAGADTLPPPPNEVYTPSQMSPCEATTLDVYFQRGESVLSDAARNAIAEVSKSGDACAIGAIEIKSISPASDPALAAERAALVERTLKSQGVDTSAVRAEVSHVSRNSAALPSERRVTVTLAAYRPEIG